MGNSNVNGTSDSEYQKRCAEISRDAVKIEEIRETSHNFGSLNGITVNVPIENMKVHDPHHEKKEEEEELHDENDEMEETKITHGFIPLPIAPVPYEMLLKEYTNLQRLQRIHHKLLFNMSRDIPYLLYVFEGIATADPNYSGKQFEILKAKVNGNHFNCKWNYFTLRVDYMRNKKKKGLWTHIETQLTPGGIYWVEKVSHMHQYVVQRHVMERPMKEYDNEKINNVDKDNLLFAPAKSGTKAADGIAIAARKVHPDSPVVLMIRDGGEPDGTAVTQELFKKHGIITIYKTFKQVGEEGKIDPKTKDLIIGKHRISFAYMRGGSKPSEFNCPKGNDWKGRKLIEFSSCIKDCSIEYEILNSKNMQSFYSKLDVLKKYLPDDEADLLFKHFVQVHNFDERFYTTKHAMQKLLKRIINNPDKYVLKPNADGGGHCFFGKDLKKLLRKLQNKNNKEKIGLNGYIAMELIEGVEEEAGHMRGGKLNFYPSIHEVGIYSYYLSDFNGNIIELNNCIGHCIKTRNAEYDEAGIGAGYGVVNSIILNTKSDNKCNDNNNSMVKSDKDISKFQNDDEIMVRENKQNRINERNERRRRDRDAKLNTKRNEIKNNMSNNGW